MNEQQFQDFMNSLIEPSAGHMADPKVGDKVEVFLSKDGISLLANAVVVSMGENITLSDWRFTRVYFPKSWTASVPSYAITGTLK
jgi:hypothetical protein